MSKTSNTLFAGVAVFNGVMFGFGALLGVVVGIAALSNGLTVFGLIALIVGILCAVVGYRRISQAVQAAKNVNARQAARAAQAAPMPRPAQSPTVVIPVKRDVLSMDDTQPIPVQPIQTVDNTKGSAARDDGETPLT